MEGCGHRYRVRSLGELGRSQQGEGGLQARRVGEADLTEVPDAKGRRGAGQPADRLRCLLAMTKSGAGECEDTIRKGEVAVALYSLTRLPGGLLEPVGQEASHGKGECRMIDKRLQPAEVNRLLGMLDRLIIGAAKTSRQSVEAEHKSGIWTYHDCAIDRREGQVVIAGQGGTHRSCHHERQRNVADPGDRLPSEVFGCLSVIVLRAPPAHQMALLPTPRGQCGWR